MFRKLVFAATMSILAQSLAHADAVIKPAFLGEIVLPSGLMISGIEFGGISGLDYDAETEVFYAISDDRSEKAPARFYRLKLLIEEDGVKGADIISSHVLQGEDGAPFAPKTIDPEAIRFDGTRQSVFWSSERDAAGNPALYEARADGAFKRSFTIPGAYLPDAAGERGIRNNLAFEGLALSVDGKTAWVATENALAQDGPKATPEAGSLSRILGFDVESGEPVAEYVYETGPIHRKSDTEPYYNDNGLTEILEIDAGRFLAVERSFALGAGNEINLYLVETAGASDILGAERIADLDVDVATLRKTHVLTIGEGDFGLDVDNIEAITEGPEVGGKQTLVMASDNNFNPNGQFTQFVVFTLEPGLN
ncbi:esterase-like activity of phytase family protein [Nitratireductor sp. L15S-10]|uniref:esterase-like activity of phytase family protein n=1 Tax=Nitratireductor sp. L15S-10 TaxID=3034028 RepID=UPI00385760F8